MITFSDTFESFDTQIWRDRLNRPDRHNGRTHVNNQLQFYDLYPNNHEIGGGILRLRADRRATIADYPYTSGMLCSQGRFSQLYGRFEIRCRMPKGQGLWPAFWLLPDTPAWSWPPEIDIFEFLGHEHDTIHVANHYVDEDGQPKGNGTFPFIGPDFTEGFHSFSVEWWPGLLIWEVDGVEHIRTSVGVPNVPMYLVLTFAVGGNWPGNPDGFTEFPAYWDIDYIKVEQGV